MKATPEGDEWHQDNFKDTGGGLARTAMGDGHWCCLMGTPNAFYPAASPEVPAGDEGAAAICRGDDFLAEGNGEQLDEVDNF